MILRQLRQPRIAVLEIAGVLGSTVRTNEYVRIFGNLAEDASIRAVVLDINSPGGSASASDYLYMAAAKLAARKPLIAFIRGSGASGAFLLSCAARHTVALPTALVGSIGVISVRPVLRELLQRLGIQVFITKSGPLKDMGYMYREPTDEERLKEQAIVDEFHDRFVTAVAEAKHLDRETVRQYATGEVFTGRRAQELGLVDELGDLDRALDVASELAKIPRRITYVRHRRTLRERLLAESAAMLVHSLAAEVEALLVAPSRINYRRP